MSWKVWLHVVSNNAMRGQQGLLLMRKRGLVRVCVGGVYKADGLHVDETWTCEKHEFVHVRLTKSFV